VGDISLEVQPKLLRVLQEHEFERLGSARTQQVDVRIVAATHRDLRQMVEDGEFRSDLFYRLHVFPLTVPRLRDRREDIPLLVRHYVEKYSRRMNRSIDTIPSQAMEVITNYSWPGNVRELQNFIERAVIVSPGSALRPPLAKLTSGGSEPQSEAEYARRGRTRMRAASYPGIQLGDWRAEWRSGSARGEADDFGLSHSQVEYTDSSTVTRGLGGVPCFAICLTAISEEKWDEQVLRRSELRSITRPSAGDNIFLTRWLKGSLIAQSDRIRWQG
jgi:formate hydrogenlyase transcriptional activator